MFSFTDLQRCDVNFVNTNIRRPLTCIRCGIDNTVSTMTHCRLLDLSLVVVVCSDAQPGRCIQRRDWLAANTTVVAVIVLPATINHSPDALLTIENSHAVLRKLYIFSVKSIIYGDVAEKLSWRSIVVTAWNHTRLTPRKLKVQYSVLFSTLCKLYLLQHCVKMTNKLRFYHFFCGNGYLKHVPAVICVAMECM